MGVLREFPEGSENSNQLGMKAGHSVQPQFRSQDELMSGLSQRIRPFMGRCGSAQRGLGSKGDILRVSSTRKKGGLCPPLVYTKAILSTKHILLHATLETRVLRGISKPYSIWSTTLVQVGLQAQSRRERLPFENGVLKRSSRAAWKGSQSQ